MRRITKIFKIVIRLSLSVLLVLVCSTKSVGQEIDLNEPFPEDQSIKKGTLENGMTYYLYSTDVTEDVASYYLIQNVGSILENDDQQGLAHFLEHMAFNGTKNFEGKGILDTFQKHGLVFGEDINAYTSFDETVYNIDNIPTTPELIDTGLQVLHDWSNYLLLTEEEIDLERGVIKEEWRSRQNGPMRIFQQTLATAYNNSKYASRLPIGLMNIIENFEYQALRDFYHNWYRTDLQAIAIVGDFDISEMEQKIIAKFSSIPAVIDPPERVVTNIEDNEDMLYQLSTDKEISTSGISFSIRHKKSLENETVADLKEALVQSMITTMLSSRLREISQKPEAAFLGASVGYGDHTRTTNTFRINISPKPDMQEQAFTEVLTAINEAVKFGFTKTEIDRTVGIFKNYYTNEIDKIEDRSHQIMIQTFQNNFLENEAMTDLVKEFEISKRIFNQLNDSEIHDALKKLYSKKNRVLIITGVEGRNNLSESRALKIIDEIENNADIEAYTDDFTGKTLISGLNIAKGSIVASNFNEAIGSTTFSLSNGVKVHYKFTDKNKNSVQLRAISKGGRSLVADADLPSTNLLENLIQMSGIGDYNSIDLQKVLAGKTAQANVQINELTEEINGSAVTKDVETMLQLVHLRFVKPRFDPQSYQVLQLNIKNYLLQKSKNLQSKIQDSVTVTLYGKNNSKKRIFNEQYANEISFDKIKKIYNDRINNAADFEFFVVGDVKEEDLKPLLATYIASIPANENRENWTDNSVKWLSNKIDKDIYLEMEDPKSTVVITIKAKMEYNLKNHFVARALGDILQLRYDETLREQEGGTYGASARASMFKKPFGQGLIQIYFDCNPDRVEELVGIVHQELNKIKDGYIEQDDLDKTLTNYSKERAELKNYSSYDMNLLRNYFLEGYNMNDAKNFEDIVNSITIDHIQQFANDLMKNSVSAEIVFKPKQ